MGTETRPQLFLGSSVESWAMGETLTQQCRVGETGCNLLLVVKLSISRKILTVLEKIAPANLVPAAAVIRGELALYSQTGRKGFFGEKV